MSSVLFCEGLSLAVEGHLPHSDPLLLCEVELLITGWTSRSLNSKLGSEVYQPAVPCLFPVPSCSSHNEE